MKAKKSKTHLTVTSNQTTPSSETLLLDWYRTFQRPLPWRKERNPYHIWISEVMLQQTTVTAVIPYYEKFLQHFPDIQTLAKAPMTAVLSQWAGLGYYSRARNLHKAAQMLVHTGFPKSYSELLNYPGFGPYTARAVSSIAFGETVGVLDGNVIRVLSRFTAEKVEWWTTKGREILQKESDRWASMGPSHEINQGLMELGATICTPKSPHCILCPLLKTCKAFQMRLTENLPLSRPRRSREIWTWDAQVYQKAKKVALITNTYAPFLKGQWIFPGTARKTLRPPKSYDYKHTITHHDIFVVLSKEKAPNLPPGEITWVKPSDISSVNPASLIKKALRLL